ncbi:MAG TPA: DUF2079 domain-containing protein [Polyangiaceae bacterium]|nr:DUF2079 domain-containing protein [Polyangiaceae bacterium]
MTAPELALSKAPSISRADAEEAPPLTVACRALLILSGIGLSLGFAVGFLLLKDPLAAYLTNNEMRPGIRRFVLGMGFGTALVVDVATLVAAFRTRRATPIATTIRRVAHRLAPLGVTGFLPFLFQWKAWRDRDVEFLTLVTLAAILLEVGVRARRSAEPLGPEHFVHARLARFRSDLAARLPRAAERAPWFLVCAGALAYAVYFSYVTIAWHYGVRSSYDLAVENNLSWNIVHGGPFFKSSPQLGPVGSRFGYDASLLAFVLAPVYALYQRPETLYVAQAALLGAAAIPLFLYARLHVGTKAACLLSLLYLLFPGVHGENLFEFHYLPLSTGFLWLALYALESRRDRLAAIAVALALAATQNVAIELLAFGLYLLIAGRRPRAGLVVAAVSAAYFVVLEAIVLRSFQGGESLAQNYARLLPTGDDTIGSAVRTVFSNPWYTVGTILESDKLAYLMQMLVPLALVPLRLPLSALLAAPALAFTTLSSQPSNASIHYQQNAYWVAFVFVAAVIVLSSRARHARHAALWAMTLATLATSYQYGAVLQHNTSSCGPVPYKFGVDHEGYTRHQSLLAVLKDLPPRAKVAGSAFTTPQVSSRPDAYSLTIGVFDAEYVLFPSSHADFVANEYDVVTGLLRKGTFGVVDVAPPFALARRGGPVTRNAEVLSMLR